MTVRQMVVEIRDDLREMRAELASKETTEDHEVRIRYVERWVYGIPPAFLLSVAGIVTAFLR